MHSQVEDLSRSADRANPPAHPQLVSGWVWPQPPEGFEQLIALGGPTTVEWRRKFAWLLDYLDLASGKLASEQCKLTLPWAWIVGFNPQASDWDAIGIPHPL